MDEIEKKARELLAAEVFPEGGFGAELIKDMLIKQLGTVATEQALSAIAAALRSAQVPEWRPIETAPRDGTHIIAWRGTAHPPHAESMYWCGFDGAEHGKCDGAWHWVQDGDAPKAGPTHWMPLPPAPHASA